MSVSLAEIEAVYRARGADFFRFALARTGDPEAARDAVQDGFARAIRRRWSYRGTGSVEAWLARCVINAAHDARGTRGCTELDEDRVTDPEPFAESVAIREAVRDLPVRQRDALFLRYYLDFDYAAIAAALNVEVGTVSATLHGARASLAQRLEELTG